MENLALLERKFFPPTGQYEYYDSVSDTYYDSLGNKFFETIESINNDDYLLKIDGNE
jgi:hypothetical protein